MSRQVTRLRDGWRFSRDDRDEFSSIGYDDTAWASVRVPHDWAIEGPFDKAHDINIIKQAQADVEGGTQQITGRTGGLPHVGVGWYRRSLPLPGNVAGKRIRVEFDGVMSHGTVFCNGKKVGHRPYGYASFACDITDHVIPGGDNVLAVRADNPPLASRWYPGAGLYRNVRLVVMESVHVAHWGVRITTPEIGAGAAKVNIRVSVENHAMPVDALLCTVLRDASGREVGRVESRQNVDASAVFEQTATVDDPQLWSIETPTLYTAETALQIDGAQVDALTTAFGFRTTVFDADQGFSLNGKAMKMNGVCMHHDLGPLGAAMNTAALRRQLRILKTMGCNAIRTSHNPPAPELLELTDEMGFLVLDEIFDEWATCKMENGYHRHFEEWAERDVRDWIRRDANHPSIIMWSIGNEIPEQNKADGGQVAQYLADICHDEDPSRPTTAGFNGPYAAIANGLADAVDIPGWNYQPHRYGAFHQRLKGKPTYGSETESTVSSRGIYHFPVNEEVREQACHKDLHVSSYDMSYPVWAYSPDVEFAAQDACPFIMGEFVWTGFDYLGEPTPYMSPQWPSRSSYFGIVDLCGIPKDRFYLYQSRWTNAPVLHLLPHWTWPGREGAVTPVHCYTNYPSVELFLNGRSLGRRQKRVKLMMGTYRLVWPAVLYEPGELKAVAYDADGGSVAEEIVRTAHAPAVLEAVADHDQIRADGDDMAFITIRVADADGQFCATATNTVRVSVDGPAELVALGSGDPTSLESFHADSRRLFSGAAVAYIRSLDGAKGTAVLSVESDGLRSAEVSIDVV